MNHQHARAEALLWATAILVAAALAAPAFLSLIVLPALAAGSMANRAARCPAGSAVA